MKAIKNNTIEIKVSGNFMYLPKAFVGVIGCKNISKIQFLHIGHFNEWFIAKSNRFGKGCKITKHDGQCRLYGKFISGLRKLMGVKVESFILVVELTPRISADGRKFYPVYIKDESIIRLAA